MLLQKQKQRAREQLEAATKTRESVRGSLKDLKANMKFTTVEAIDEAIAAAEYRMEHHSLSLGEEKRVLEDIKKLRGSRTLVAQYSEKLEQLGQVGGGRGGVSMQVGEFSLAWRPAPPSHTTDRPSLCRMTPPAVSSWPPSRRSMKL
jgi:hypothetical protein